jgi:uncharacterized membrane protein YjjP (DUF1212 family)
MAEPDPAAAAEAAALRQQEAIRFVESLGSALHRYGTPANRLDEVLELLSGVYGLKGHFFSTPSAIFFSYDLPEEEGYARLKRLYGNDLDLDKLARLDQLFNRVVAGEVRLADGPAEVERITAGPTPYPAPLTLAAFAATPAAAAGFFGGGLPEAALAGAAGFGLGLLYLLIPRSRQLGRLFEPAGAFIVTLITLLLAGALGASSDVATLAGLISLVPGFSLTIGATELALKQPVSGLGRLASASVTLMMLTVGVLAARETAAVLFETELTSLAAVPGPPWQGPVGLIVAGLGLGILFRAAPRDIPWVVAAVMLPYAAFEAGIGDLSRVLSVFLGGLIAGVFGNVYARLLDRPSMVVRLPGILILVPGATGFLSLSELAQGDALQGIKTLFQVFMTATALVAGLLLSNAVVSPRKAL